MQIRNCAPSVRLQLKCCSVPAGVWLTLSTVWKMRCRNWNRWVCTFWNDLRTSMASVGATDPSQLGVSHTVSICHFLLLVDLLPSACTVIGCYHHWIGVWEEKKIKSKPTTNKHLHIAIISVFLNLESLIILKVNCKVVCSHYIFFIASGLYRHGEFAQKVHTIWFSGF